MLKDYEIKVLDHYLIDYNVWAEHAVAEECFSDIETALHYKAEVCSHKWVFAFEASNEIISTSKDQNLENDNSILETKKNEYMKELNDKTKLINTIDQDIYAIDKTIVKKIFLKQMSEHLQTKTEIRQLQFEEKFNNDKTLLKDEKDKIKLKIDYLKALITKRKAEAAQLTTELATLDNNFETKNTESQTIKNDLTSYLTQMKSEIETITVNVDKTKLEIMQEKINHIHGRPGYKNRVEREAEVNES